MQQLSLFDFGEQTPKPEKKNKASKSGMEHSDSTPEKENGAEPPIEESRLQKTVNPEPMEDQGNKTEGLAEQTSHTDSVQQDEISTQEVQETVESYNELSEATPEVDAFADPENQNQKQENAIDSDKHNNYEAPLQSLTSAMSADQTELEHEDKASPLIEEGQLDPPTPNAVEDNVIGKHEGGLNSEADPAQKMPSTEAPTTLVNKVQMDFQEGNLQEEQESEKGNNDRNSDGPNHPISQDQSNSKDEGSLENETPISEENIENTEPKEDFHFSNDQIRIKKVVVKTLKTPPSFFSKKPDENIAKPSINAKEGRSEIDTSFSPDQFTNQELNPAQDEVKNNGLNEVAESKSDQIDAPNSIEEKQIERISVGGSTELDANLGTEQVQTAALTHEPGTASKKPFYIEDQTVPVRKRGRKSFKEIDAEVDLINIPPDEELFQKQYYPISVVAKWFRVNNSLLRFWENEFKILKPRKNKKGDRFFRPEDVKNLQLIYYLLRQKKLTINGAIKHLKSYKEQTEVNMQLIQTLNDFKGFLLELKAGIGK